MAIRFEVKIDGEDDLEDLAHYSSCEYHGPMILGLMFDAADRALQKNGGRYPYTVVVNTGDYRPGMDVESDVDGPSVEEELDSEMPFAPKRQAPATA